MIIRTLAGDEIRSALQALAILRVEIFRAFPYLYAGTVAYEQDYLRDFANTRDAVIVVAETEDGKIVGCATGSALLGHHSEFATPLASAGFSLSSTFYFGESVLRAPWRGRGIGHAFFDAREAFARDRGYKRACFCAVERPDDHPERPENYSPLDAFWIKRGYERLPNVKTEFDWPTELDGPNQMHPMVYWIRDLRTPIPGRNG